MILISSNRRDVPALVAIRRVVVAGDPSSNTFAHEEVRVDFAHRAVHETTVAAKRAIDAFYGAEVLASIPASRVRNGTVDRTRPL